MPDRYDIEQAALASMELAEAYHQSNRTVRLSFLLLSEVEPDGGIPVSVDALYVGYRKEAHEEWVMDVIPETSSIRVGETQMTPELLVELGEVVHDQTKIASSELLAALEGEAIRLPAEEPQITTFFLSRVTGIILTVGDA
jgi:hypothetical protein